MKCYYFGCYRDVGHFLRDSISKRITEEVLKSNPWRYSIDSGLCPKTTTLEGKCTLNKKDGMTCISFWDYSIDKRPGSNSAFLVEGDYDFLTMIELFKEKFPEVVSRFKYELTLISV